MSGAVVLALCAGAAAGAALPDLAAGLIAMRHSRGVRSRGGSVALLARLGRRIGIRRVPGDLAARIAAAGTPLKLGVADVMAVKAGAAAIGALAVAPLAVAAPGRTGLIAMAGALGGGFAAPDVWLRRRAAARARSIAVELPDILDLLRVAVQAGLPAGRAIEEVGRRHAGLLARELRRATAEVGLGVAREQALDDLVLRAPAPSVAALRAAVARSDRHGAPLAPALAALAIEARAEQGRALTEQAAKAAPKIQLAVALLLVPSVLLLVGAVVVRGIAA